MASAKHRSNGNNSDKVVYEVRRLRKSGEPTIEEHLALDRARLAALSYALDGDWAENRSSGKALTGIVEVHRVFYHGGKWLRSTLVDELDERVAFRLLNEVELPRAGQLSLTVEQFQGPISTLAKMGV